jgi:putative flippase GtrA
MRFMKFAIIGVANTAITFTVFNVAAIGFHVPALWANALAWVAGFANSFVWNRLWTFADRQPGRVGVVLLRFAAVNVLALAVSTLIVAALQAALSASAGKGVSAGELNAIEAAAVGGALCVSYLFSSRWAFRTRRG